MLRKLQHTDAHRMLEWMKEPDINHFFRWNAEAITIDTVNNFIDEAAKNEKDVHMAVVNEQDVYMGTVSLKDINTKDKNAEYAISLHKDAIGKSYAWKATEEILRIAFNELDLHRVYLNVRTDNLRAKRFYQKFGFDYEGKLRNHLLKDGTFYDLDLFAILKDDFENRMKKVKEAIE